MNFTNLNESFENKYKVSKKALKEHKAIKKAAADRKAKLLESTKKTLTERYWRLTVPGSYRADIFNAADEDDIEHVKDSIIAICNYVIDNAAKTRLKEDELEDFIAEWEDLKEELEYQDFEDEEEADYWLGEMYDLMDNSDVFLGLEESLKEDIYRQYEDPYALEDEYNQLKAYYDMHPDEKDDYAEERLASLSDRINFAWQDDEYDSDYYRDEFYSDLYNDPFYDPDPEDDIQLTTDDYNAGQWLESLEEDFRTHASTIDLYSVVTSLWSDFQMGDPKYNLGEDDWLEIWDPYDVAKLNNGEESVVVWIEGEDMKKRMAMQTQGDQIKFRFLESGATDQYADDIDDIEKAIIDKFGIKLNGVSESVRAMINRQSIYDESYKRKGLGESIHPNISMVQDRYEDAVNKGFKKQADKILSDNLIKVKNGQCIKTSANSNTGAAYFSLRNLINESLHEEKIVGGSMDKSDRAVIQPIIDAIAAFEEGHENEFFITWNFGRRASDNKMTAGVDINFSGPVREDEEQKEAYVNGLLDVINQNGYIMDPALGYDKSGPREGIFGGFHYQIVEAGEDPDFFKEALEGSSNTELIIQVKQGLNADGFTATVMQDGEKVFSKNYNYGYNASYSRTNAEKAARDAQLAKKYGWEGSYYNEKPYTSDIIKTLCTEYNIPKSNIKVTSGRNIFRGDGVNSEDTRDFVDEYVTPIMNESLSEEETEDDDDFELDAVEQEFTSANTSINKNKLPAIFKKVNFEPNTVNLDYGGGKFDNAAEHLAEQGVTNLVYDKYNRTPEHNKKVIKTIRANGGADTVTCCNVLNVIKEPEERLNVVRNIQRLLRPNGTAYFYVYAGNSSGTGRQTGKDQYQLNRKQNEYLEEIKQVFPNAKPKSGMIVATNGGSANESLKENVEYKGHSLNITQDGTQVWSPKGKLLRTTSDETDAMEFIDDFELEDEDFDESLNEARQPKYWNTMFAEKVRNAFDKGELTFDNIEEWDTAYNGGIKPQPPFNTRDILNYYIKNKDLTEDTIKQNGKWVNKGKEGTHGKFKTKKQADAQRKAMFANKQPGSN